MHRWKPPRVLMLTCGVFALGGAPSDAAHGGAWGFARVLRLEHMTLRAQSTDILLSESLLATPLMLAPTLEAEALRTADLHYVARLRACTIASKANASLAVGAYVITGGLGGLGLRATKLLVDRGASAVVLSSRSGLVSTSAVAAQSSSAIWSSECVPKRGCRFGFSSGLCFSLSSVIRSFLFG